MKRVYSISEAADQVRRLIKDVNTFYYFVLELEEKEYQIRVSDHSANAGNNRSDYDGFFSFVLNYNNQPCNMVNEYIIDNDGDFSEEFTSVEECLEWNLN